MGTEASKRNNSRLVSALIHLLFLLAYCVGGATATHTSFFHVEAGDASLVNTASELRVPFTAQRREVTRLGGEAKFNVTRDTIRAFDALRVSALRAAVQQVMSWTHGQLLFDRKTLANAEAELNRCSRHQFVMDHPGIANLQIRGAFDAEALESFSAALRSFGGTVYESGANTIRLSKGMA